VPFLLGVGTFMNVRLVGYVTLSEIFVLVWFGYLLLSGGLKLRSPTMRWLISFSLIWIISVVLTDFYREAIFQQFARGFGRTVVMFCALPSGYLYFRKYPAALKPLFVGFMVSAVINIFGFRAGSEEFVMIHGYELESSWERNYTYVTLMLCFCAAAYFYRRAPWRVVALVVLLGVVNIAMGSRNLGGNMIAAGMIAAAARQFFPVASGRRAGSPAAVAAITCMILMVGASVYIGYKFAAAHGVLGEKSYEKYAAQSSSPLGVLLASRADFIGGLLALKDSPVIGYGSWPIDTEGYMVEAFQLAGVDESYIKELRYINHRIPAHSMLLEAWVEHGVFAMLFWVVVMVVVFRAIAAGALQDREWGLVNCLVTIWMIWNLLFSPLGNRIYTVVMILILVLASEHHLITGKPKAASTARRAERPPGYHRLSPAP
jgi:hypothetical protein